MYPVMLNLRDRRCLVVGGGGVALRKVEGLVAEGALVTVVATEPIGALESLAEKREITLERRVYEPGEISEYTIGFAATDDRDVNIRVFEDGEASGIWVNVADDPELCNFHLPARLRRGALQLVIGSAGEAPFVVRRLRQFLERRFGPEWAEWMEAAGRFRKSVRKQDLANDEKEDRYDRFFSETVDEIGVKARVPTTQEEAEWLAGDKASTEPTTTSSLVTPHDEASVEPLRSGVGFVSLVGAGPGDAGLLTLRGRQRLMAADTVVYDHLAETALPCDLPPQVELHSVGKKAGHHPMPQEEINALLVRLGREGKRVVRLKGGDPYVFGRGGEEAEELAAAGVPYEVVPCVTAAVAVPTYAGIPVTHRKEVSRITMVTAHESIKKGGPQVRWDLLAADHNAMLLGYMGVNSLPRVVHQLISWGMDPKTPAAMVERGTTSGQKVVRSPVAKLPQAVKDAGINPPALFIIGPAVDYADKLDWFGARPLMGERLVVPAPAGDLSEALELSGVDVVEVPLPVTPAARIVMNALPLTGCVFRSPDEVEALEEERDGAGWGSEMVAWSLSAEAAKRARALRWRHVEQVEVSADAHRLANAIGAWRKNHATATP
jgi:uroporphyrin-III C-methyltransferase/precorrin-2 dehydrogenase/sirohydrochlorin ferrochelatase